MRSLSFRRRPANWSAIIRAYIDKPGMTSHDSAETGSCKEHDRIFEREP